MAMPRIGLPTADLGETHSLRKARKPVMSFCPTLHVHFVCLAPLVCFVFVHFVEYNKPNNTDKQIIQW